MPLESDITLNVAKFEPASSSEQSKKLNEHLIQIMEAGPKWYEVGAPKYRQMRWANETPLPAPKLLPQAIDVMIPSREPGREIPCRLLYPESRSTEELRKKCNGVAVHFHGGGWVLGDEKSTDVRLQQISNAGDLAVISVGYRHAPENPFPNPTEDCIDAGEYLVDNAESQYGGPLRFITGESAGGHLSLITAFHLLKAKPSLKLSGLLLHFGCFDLSELPSVKNFDRLLVLDQQIMRHFLDAFVPNTSAEERKHPSISPYYEDMKPLRSRLPPALFTIGTEDPLLDDSIAMATKWLIFGGKAVLKVYPGAPHGFTGFAPELLKESGEAAKDTDTFIQECLEGV